LLETAPVEKRAAMTIWQGYSQQLAVVLGSLVGVVLTTMLTTEQLYAWGWRVPFAIGLVIAPVALYIRRQLPETIAESQTHRSSTAVLRDLARGHWRAVVCGVFVISGATISTYVFNYMTTYAITTLGLSARVGTVLTLTGAVAQIAGMAVGAWADRFGRKGFLVAWRVLFVLAIYPAYRIYAVPETDPAVIVAVNMLLNFLFAAGIGAMYAFLLEAFPKSVRSSGLGLLYALSVATFGGTTQFVVAWLIARTSDPLVPAWYQIVWNVASIVGVLLLAQHAEVAHERRAARSPSAG
jgi:MFS family permease